MKSLLSKDQVSMRDVFGETLLKLSLESDKVYAIDGDLANSTKIDAVAKGILLDFCKWASLNKI